MKNAHHLSLKLILPVHEHDEGKGLFWEWKLLNLLLELTLFGVFFREVVTQEL